MASILGGMGGGREYVLKIVADVKDAIKGVDDVADKTTSMKDRMLGVGKGIATGLAAAAVAKFGMDCVNAAADADDAMDQVNASFGASAKEIEKFSKGAAENMGMSSDEFQMMAAGTGNLLQSMGISAGDAAKQTETMSTRAADMAAIWGTDVPTAMDAIDKAMTGSTKGLQAFNVKISKAEVDARAMSKGYVDASGKVTDAGRAIAAQELILEKTSNMAGGFADNSKDLGSQQDIMRAKMKDLQVTIGTALLPIIQKLMEFVTPMIDFISKNIGWIAPLAGIILGIAAAMKVWTIAQMAFNVVMAANPIVLVALAIAGLVAGIIWAYNNVGWFKDAVDAMGKAVVATFNWILDVFKDVWNWISDNWPLLLAILTGPFGLAVKWIIDHWGQIKDFFWRLPGEIRQLIGQVADIISYPFKIAADKITGFFDPIKDFFWRLPGQIRTFFGQLADIITYPFKAAFNAIKYLWNTTVGGFGINVPSWLPLIGGKSWTIPRMASGGIVNRPTLAIIGEAGPEAVVPLSQMGGDGIGATYIVNVYTLNANAETGRVIAESLREYNRTAGTLVR